MTGAFPPGTAYQENFAAIGDTDVEGRPGFKMALHRASAAGRYRSAA